jgi:hypothetical protein
MTRMTRTTVAVLVVGFTLGDPCMATARCYAKADWIGDLPLSVDRKSDCKTCRAYLDPQHTQHAYVQCTESSYVCKDANTPPIQTVYLLCQTAPAQYNPTTGEYECDWSQASAWTAEELQNVQEKVTDMDMSGCGS